VHVFLVSRHGCRTNHGANTKGELMGAEYYEGVELSNKHAADAFAVLAEACAWESGHGGYTGTFAETPGCILMGKLPPRISSEKFATLISQGKEIDWYGHYTEHIYAEPEPGASLFPRTVERTIKRRKVKWPKSMQTPTMQAMIERFIKQSELKWEPAAAVECNAVETREYKKSTRKQGTRGKLYYFAATCSS